ncbi:MAG: T9SS type A sorting domain-containing protein [Ignavibacteriae bacterium]|nr:T9SS type A sorting domain-containing protein [Ignavibacteriota bacterium]
MQRSVAVLVAIGVVLSPLYAGESNRVRSVKTRAPLLPNEAEIIATTESGQKPPPSSHVTPLSPPVGVYTTLNGFFDYQSNGGACQHIRVNPANGNIHVIYMISEDSLDSGGPTRGTVYAFSSDGGSSWNNFSNVRVPIRRSGYPSLDLLQGPNQGLPVIANHNVVSVLQSTLFVDAPEGTGTFAELIPPLIMPPMTGGEPIWPHVAGAADGSIVFHASINNQLPTGGGGPNYLTRTSDFGISWSPLWMQFPPPFNDPGGAYPTIANGTGRVGTFNLAPGDGAYWLESTDNGATWPSMATTIYPATRVVGSDTLSNWVGGDVIYNGEIALFAMNTSRTDGEGGFFYAGSRIEFWSQATGFVDAVPWDSTLYLSQMVGQAFHLSMGYPVLGLSGSTIALVYMAFQPDTGAGGFNYGDVWYVLSNDGGFTWTSPTNITNTPNLDERYPSISRWNEPGELNITWQEDTQPGAHAFGDNAPISRSSQVFLKMILTDVNGHGEVPNHFVLRQNYPNPFNPATKISYTIPTGSSVRLSVYNTLGQEVETLADEYRNAGTYEVTFSGESLASGVYFYRLKAGPHTESKKMTLLR